MTKKDIDWEKELKPKPFRNNSFTPQMMRRVEEQLKAGPSRVSTFGRRAGVLTLGAALLAGVIALESSGALSSLRQKPAVSAPDTPRQSVWLAFPHKKEDGSVGTGAVSVPLETVQARMSVGYPRTETAPSLPKMTFALTEEEAAQLKSVLVYHPDDGQGYLLLVPRTWTLVSAVAGANGSFSSIFADPDNPVEQLEYDVSFNGPAISGIGTYFPDRAEWAGQQGYEPDTREGTNLRVLYSNEAEEKGFSRYEWTRQGEGAVAGGAAYYSMTGQGNLFRKLEMSLAGTANSTAADTILRFFEDNDGALEAKAQALKPEEMIYDIKELYERLRADGLVLSDLSESDTPVYDRPVNGVEPRERLIDLKKAGGARPERLTFFRFASREDAQAGLENLNGTLNAGAGTNESGISPHLFIGANFVVVYWTGGDSENPFGYDKAIRDALNDYETGKIL
ncbi:DUF4850 domain-containing protein [Saccharibacillus sp. CPCC 101409]|uniref:DUF4850 domain-containing protein n=1 Tax=Saccharibacillus sp. CPCC 101409 TaxID=3058041 RepID=UPI0026728C6C|nr:DUF4850 domain-containing protein [Saccharibacillus sp. CPCC 101409]MDO3410064.1 DUF4850 domain-containing protein [Saccharibacillus sp. CPCC 101409]